ncbi:uncharacterized protein LOC116165467 [Photinus pyralis]|uniref:uncharacterized protein LOC116165467 n=1 Tax=Photinus pyralis TaxID=7054 RepID=UPI0012674A3C|nr:uncharacterized protein LOC116165467 [Photinus pyralis]
MSDLRGITKEFLTEFILLYRSFPCLWKTKSKEYMDRNKKNDAYKILTEKLKEVEENATKEAVKTKINTLRGGFRREMKKVLNSKRSGAGADDVYVPNLWYYELLLFIKDQELPRQSVTNIEVNCDNEENASEIFMEQQNETEENRNVDNEDFALSPASNISRAETAHSKSETIVTTPATKQKRRRHDRKAEEQTDEILAVVSERLRAGPKIDDNFSIFGANVAAKLRSLPTETRLYSEKLINDVLFEAEMGNINRTTKIVTSSIQSFASQNNTFNYPSNYLCGVRTPFNASYTLNSQQQAEPIYQDQAYLGAQHSSEIQQNINNPPIFQSQGTVNCLPVSSSGTSDNNSQTVVSFVRNFTP